MYLQFLLLFVSDNRLHKIITIVYIIIPSWIMQSIFSKREDIFFSLSLSIVFVIGRTLVSVVTSGSKRFFCVTDSAPPVRRKMECSCGCAGIYNAPIALSVKAKIFEDVISLEISFS